MSIYVFRLFNIRGGGFSLDFMVSLVLEFSLFFNITFRACSRRGCFRMVGSFASTSRAFLFTLWFSLIRWDTANSLSSFFSDLYCVVVGLFCGVVMVVIGSSTGLGWAVGPSPVNTVSRDIRCEILLL